jgi:O-acetyl-ADP-ribose deacetylase (regulator of RNase III)
MIGPAPLVIEKDVTELKPPFVLVHLANDKGAMGRGVAKAISDKWPQVLTDYRPLASILGTISITEVVPDGLVISLVAQKGYGTDRVRVNYEFLKECLTKMIPVIQSNDLPVFAPFHIGCGLAGGNWTTVLEIFSALPYHVTFCKLPEGLSNVE